MYFLKNFLLYSQALIRQTKYVVMMTKEGSTKIVNFMTPGAGVFVLGRSHTNHIVKIHISLKFFSTPVDQTNYVYSNDEQGMGLLGCGHISHIARMNALFL